MDAKGHDGTLVSSTYHPTYVVNHRYARKITAYELLIWEEISMEVWFGENQGAYLPVESSYGTLAIPSN